MKWDYKSESESGGTVIKYTLAEDGVTMSNNKVIERLITSAEFRAWFNQLLQQVKFEAFFWEVKPVKKDTIRLPFEFVVVESQSLQNLAPDRNSFEQYFSKENSVVSFHNLRKDALLIVPCPSADESTYTHLAKFVRLAPEKQTDRLWKTVGEEFKSNITTGLRWLSTAGLGVAWLHIRIDSNPKYYRYKAYANSM